MQVVYGFSVVSLKDKGQAEQRSLQISVYNPELVCEEINNLFLGFNRITLSFSFNYLAKGIINRITLGYF